MLHPQLKTFLVCAEAGSFSKAGSILFLSSTAVMKQINGLEERLGMKLFARTASGLTLTSAGQDVLEEARFLQDHVQNALMKITAKQAEYDLTFCVGTSSLWPAKPLMDRWYRQEAFKDYTLHLVPLADALPRFFEDFGVLYDFVCGPCRLDIPETVRFVPLFEAPMGVFMLPRNPLAKQDSISVSDGDFAGPAFCPYVKEVLSWPYVLSDFTACESGRLLVGPKLFSDAHPGLVWRPLKDVAPLTWGLYCSNAAPGDVLAAASAIQKA